MSSLAEQRYYLDVDTVWEARTGESGENFYFPPYPPAVLGDKFANGDVYQRLVIEGKPSDLKCMCWICPWQGGAECCTKPPMPVIYFTEDGTYYTKFGPITTWPGAHNNLKFNPDVAVRRTVLQVFGITGSGGKKKLRADHWSNSDIGNHVPFDIETEVILVARGDKLEQPADWPDCPAEWGCTGEGTAITRFSKKAYGRNRNFGLSYATDGALSIIADDKAITSVALYSVRGREIIRQSSAPSASVGLARTRFLPAGSYIVKVNGLHIGSWARMRH
jgi:hypothetical protein